MTLQMFHTAPQCWERTTLGAAVARGHGSIQTGPFGSQLHASDYVDVGIPSIMPVNIGDNRLVRDGISCITPEDAARLSKHIVREGDIVYSRRGDVERRALVRKEQDGWFCGTGCLKVRLGEGVVVPEFASYYLGHPEVRSWISRHAVGITMPNLNTGIMEAVPFLLPPYETQSAIAGILGALDDKIEQNRRTARALERLARAIFRAWFVDFEPVKAKAAGAASFPSMPQAAFDALPTRLVDSAIGPVPEGWEVKAMSEVAEATKGLSYKGAGLVKDPAQFATAKPLHNLNSIYEGGGYKNQGVKYYSGDFKPRHVLKPGDLIVANTEQGFEYRLIGFPAIVPERFGLDGLFTHHTFKLHPRENASIGRHYLYHALLGGRVREEVCGCTNGTTVNMLSVDGLQRPLLCVPQPAIAESFEEAAGAMYQQSELLHDESAKLAELRDLLLPKLLSGEVRITRPEEAA